MQTPAPAAPTSHAPATHIPAALAVTYLPTAEAASFLGLSSRTLEKYRVIGGGPVYRKLGRRVVYAQSDLREWADARRRDNTSDPGPLARASRGR